MTMEATSKRSLLMNLRTSVTLSFHDDPISRQCDLQPIVTGCVDILMNGLQLMSKAPKRCSTSDVHLLRKLIDDFEWLHRSVEVRRCDASMNAETMMMMMKMPTTQTKKSVTTEVASSSMALLERTTTSTATACESFLLSWTERNLKAKHLCSCLQALIAERDLLESHYESSAFLRSEQYATALCICLSAFELNQCSLLSQIDATMDFRLINMALGSEPPPSPLMAMAESTGVFWRLRKRSNSQPNFAIMSPQITMNNELKQESFTIGEKHQHEITSINRIKIPLQLRRIQSLPNFVTYLLPPPIKAPRNNPTTQSNSSSINNSVTQPKNIPVIRNTRHLAALTSSPSSSSYNSHSGEDDVLPTTSSAICRKKRNFRNIFNESRVLISPTHTHQSMMQTRALATSPSQGTSSSLSASSLSSITTTMPRRIEVIKCDDIKIWTDLGRDSTKQTSHQHHSTASSSTMNESQHHSTIRSPDIPPVAAALPIAKHTTKSVSPISSFLASMFSTPPTYTSWSNSTFQLVDDEMSATETAVAAADINDIMSNDTIMHSSNIPADNQPAIVVISGANTNVINSSSIVNNNNSLSSVSMFDSFLPVDGKKMRSRRSQNLFEDNNEGICSIDTYSYRTIHSDGGVSGRKSAAKLNGSSSSNDALNVDNGYNADPTINTDVPTKNCQSLTRFLQMAQLSRNNTDLEKENAHFRIAEAIISVIEHIKCAKLDTKQGQDEDSSQSAATATATDWLNRSGDEIATTTEYPAEISSSRKHEKNEAKLNISESNVEEYIPYAEVGESCLDLLSAEVVGLSLISRFSDRQLPRVSDLKWLVSEDDTPQQLLPMPDDTPTSNPDDNVIPSVTRGTSYWAPPRQQIIFTEHPPPNRNELIRKQNNRCAGCGMRTSRRYMQSFRYCTYLGKYHCTGCHRNQISVVPAKILKYWDFKCYPVSVFAYRLLEQMYTFPLFHVPDLSPALYTRSKELLRARDKRGRLQFVKDFIMSCRFAMREQLYFENIPSHIANDVDMWSISDFMDTYKGSLQRSIDELIARCEQHVFNCVLCTARGFICEYCRKDHIIYPWQPKITRCDHCGSCFHRKCWKSMISICCRCQRFIKRQIEIHDDL